MSHDARRWDHTTCKVRAETSARSFSQTRVQINARLCIRPPPLAGSRTSLSQRIAAIGGAIAPVLSYRHWNTSPDVGAGLLAQFRALSHDACTHPPCNALFSLRPPSSPTITA